MDKNIPKDQKTEVIQCCPNGHECKHYKFKEVPKVYSNYNPFCDMCERDDIPYNCDDGFYHCSLCEWDKCFKCRVMSPIMYAIVINDLSSVQMLSKEDGFEINKKFTDCHDRTVFIKACKIGNLKIVKYLISLDCDLYAKDIHKMTGFLHACRCGHLDIVKFLKSIGYNIYEKHKSRKSGFHLATRNGRIEILKYFVSVGWNINDLAAFYCACSKGNVKIMKYFIELGYRDQVDENQSTINTPFICACSSKNLDAVKYLISLGYNINDKSKIVGSGYNIAIKKNNILLAVLLLEYGCEITKTVSKNENLNLAKVIENRIQEIKKSKQTIKDLWVDVEMLVIDKICEFAYGLTNLQRPNIFTSSSAE